MGGAGIAGLPCVLDITDRGIHGCVYEAFNRVGGRVFSIRRGYWNDGQITEGGGELIDTGQECIQALAQRFGLELDDLFAAKPTESEATYRFFRRYHSKAQADRDFSAILDAVVANEAAAPFPTTFESFKPAGGMLDNMRVYQWIESRAPGGRGSPLDRLFD